MITYKFQYNIIKYITLFVLFFIFCAVCTLITKRQTTSVHDTIAAYPVVPYKVYLAFLQNVFKS